MTTTSYQNKTFYVNSSLTQLTTSNGSKFSTPNFYYKSSCLLKFVVSDANQDPVNLSAGTFEFKINDTYNGTNLLTVANSNFTTGTFAASGIVSCKANFNQAAIVNYIDEIQEDTAQCSLWCTIAGISYLLVAFECNIKNLIH
jgi:hypothetical protein